MDLKLRQNLIEMWLAVVKNKSVGDGSGHRGGPELIVYDLKQGLQSLLSVKRFSDCGYI